MSEKQWVSEKVLQIKRRESFAENSKYATLSTCHELFYTYPTGSIISISGENGRRRIFGLNFTISNRIRLNIGQLAVDVNACSDIGFVH